MAGAIALTGLVGAATFAVSVMATPTPDGALPSQSRTAQQQALAPASETAAGLSAGLLTGDGVRAAALLDRHWDRAALGADSLAHGALLSAPYARIMEIAPGDTLMSVLLDAGLGRPAAFEVIQTLSEVFDPRMLRPGQELEVAIAPAIPTAAASVAELRFRPDPLREFVVEPTEDGYAAREVEAALTEHNVRSEGRIESSLYVAARDAGVPLPVLGELINVFSFDIDFQREVQPGDRFSLMFSEKRTEAGDAVDYGDILLAEMSVAGTVKRFYRFTDDEGRTDYYDSRGQSVRKALLRTPVEGARISSGFGKRKHPILGYTKMHKGLDFAAPTGTPIYAAGDGIVEAAGRNGGYGNYIRIRHNDTYSTAYAHLHRIDSRVKRGARVQQRQIIGYVGSTGRSTGPHLHYEVLINGEQTNPLSVRLPTGKTLKGPELARFERERADIETQFAGIEPRTQVADAAE
jgi:murein DD-endopeptidase MepM/ murein hydrolase activator NlpD